MTTIDYPTESGGKRTIASDTTISYKITLYDSVADQFTAPEGFHTCQVVRIGNAVEIRIITNSEKT